MIEKFRYSAARAFSRGARRTGGLANATVLAALLCGFSGAGLAAGPAAGTASAQPQAAPAPAGTKPGTAPAAAGPPLAEMPAAPVYGPKTGPLLLTNPVAAMTAMAESLEKRADAVVLDVEGRSITQGDVADVLRAMPISMASLGFETLYRRALEQLVRQKAMVIAAEKIGLDKDPVARRKGRAAMERALAEEWVTRTVDTAVPEQAVHTRYERDIAGKPGPEEVRARVILVPTDAEARGLIGQVQAGADFSDLATRFSKDASAVAGGDLGYVRLEALGPEIGSALFSLSPGQVTAYPVKTQAGYFIVRIEGRRQRATPTYEEAYGDLLRELRREAALTVIRAQTGTVKTKEYAVGEKTLPPEPGGALRPANR